MYRSGYNFPKLDVPEKALYVVPVTPPGFPEQLSSMSANDVLVGTEDVTVTVAAARDAEALALASAALARCASTPVPAARPTTAAARMTMTTHSTNTRVVHPRMVPLFFFVLAPSPPPGWSAPSSPAAVGCA